MVIRQLLSIALPSPLEETPTPKGLLHCLGGIKDGEASLDDQANASCFSLSLHFVDKMDKAFSIVIDSHSRILKQCKDPRGFFRR